MKTLVVYYSYTGNTEGIAKRIAAVLHANLEKLEMVKPYSNNYQEVVREAQKDVENDYKPDLKPLKYHLKDYDHIVVGTPTFWYKMAPAVLTFLSDNDFSNKTVVPFMTNAGWPGTVIADMTKCARKKGATVEKAKEIKFKTQNDGTTTGMATSEKELESWISSLK